MNLQGEHDFFIQVALDKELRHELKAQQTIERAFQKDRVGDNANYGTIQAGVTAMLATLPQSPVEAESVERVPSQPAKSNLYRYLLGAGIFLLLGITFFTLNFSEEITLMQSLLPEMQRQGMQMQRPTVEREKSNVAGESTYQSEEVVKEEMGVRSERPTHLSHKPSVSAAPAVTTKQSDTQDVQTATHPTTSDPSPPPITADSLNPLNTLSSPEGLMIEPKDSINVGAKLKWKKVPTDN